MLAEASGGGPKARAAPMLALAGATASGKSAVAEALAGERGACLIACDSVQVYRGFDIGAAKPTLAQQRACRYALVDEVGWQAPFSAADWRQRALAARARAAGAGREAVVVGGTGLYLAALRDGLGATVPANLPLRAALAEQEVRHPGTSWRRLAQLDRNAAASIHPHNLPRLARALEICVASGLPLADARARAPAGATPLGIYVLCRPRAALRAAIAGRARAMVKAGWLDEVAALLARGVDPGCRPMAALGYRQVVAHLRSGRSGTGAAGAELLAAIVRDTWAYARRQSTWWRGQPRVMFWPAGEPLATARAIAQDFQARLHVGDAAAHRLPVATTAR